MIVPLTVALKSEFFKGNWLFLLLDLSKSLRIKRLLNTRTGDCVGAGARPGQTFLWIILLSDSEGKEERVSVLRLASDETVTLMRQTLHCTNRRYQMNCSLSSSSQRKWDEGLAEPVIYLLLKVFDPSLVDTLFSSCAFSSLIPTAVCQGALMASLSLSQPLRFPFFTTVVVEVKWKRMKEQFVLVYKHRLVLSSYYHTVVMQDSSDEIIAKGVFVCQIICDVRDLCVTSQFE